MTDDDKVVLVAEVISERVPLMDISNIPSDEARDAFIEEILGWISDEPRLELMLGDASESDQRACVTDAVRRTRQAISKYSSVAPKPDAYFWFMVNQIHGKEGGARLRSLSNGLRKRAKAIEKVQVAA